MTIREKVDRIINKDYTQYNIADVNELTRLKLSIGKMVAEASGLASELEQQYKVKSAQSRLLHYGEK